MILWAADLPGIQEGVPSVYQAAGREYIAVPTGGAELFQPQAPAGTAARSGAPQYVVFALAKQ